MPLSGDHLKSLLRQHPDRIPVSVGILPAAWIKHRGQLDAIVQRHPLIFGPPRQDRDYDALWKPTYAAGDHVDAWGCVWSNVHQGREAIVTGHPLPRREDVRKLRPPSQDDGLPHGFMYLRLQDLRGFEELMIDFAEEPPELQMLIDAVLAYNLRQVDLLLARQTGPELLGFGDDLGMQHALPMSPEKWRKYLKPCFAAIYGRVRRAGHTVYMHTDGQIHPILPDLIECGVQIVNPQIRANGLDNLVRTCKGRICVDLDLDRQLFPFCTPADIDRHVRDAVEALGDPAGGLWLKAEVDEGVPLPNVEAICAALEKYGAWFAR
jgi:hypothetical protein